MKKLFLLSAMLFLLFAGCGKGKINQETNTNLLLEQIVPKKLRNDPKARRYYESLLPEIERNIEVQSAITNAVATSADSKALAFRDFLSQWHLQWPVVKEGAFGMGGIGFVWNKELNEFQCSVDATTTVSEHYEFQSFLDCEVSEDYKNVNFTKLRFCIQGIREILIPLEGANEGGVTVKYDTSDNHWFGLKEWEQLKESNWDFSKIGINIVSNSPIPNIHDAFK